LAPFFVFHRTPPFFPQTSLNCPVLGGSMKTIVADTTLPMQGQTNSRYIP
jgi:hypothetical protein